MTASTPPSIFSHGLCAIIRAIAISAPTNVAPAFNPSGDKSQSSSPTDTDAGDPDMSYRLLSVVAFTFMGVLGLFRIAQGVRELRERKRQRIAAARLRAREGRSPDA
jgi:hypothetical protein